MMPLSAYGHIIPLLELAKRFSSRHRISVLLSPWHVSEVLRKGIVPRPSGKASAENDSAHAFSANFANIRLIPTDVKVEQDDDMSGGMSRLFEMLRDTPPAFEKAFRRAARLHGWGGETDEAVEEGSDCPSWPEEFNTPWPQKPEAIVTDNFCLFAATNLRERLPWMRDIKCFGLQTLNAEVGNSVSMAPHSDGKPETGSFDNIPEVPPPPKDLLEIKELFRKMFENADDDSPEAMQERYSKTMPQFRFMITNTIQALKQCDGCLVDMFYDLDPAELDKFDKAFACSVRCVGPLCGFEMLIEKDRPASADGGMPPEHKVIRSWLDSQAPKSVVYVSFGSMGHLEEEQILEMEAALLACGYPFMYSLRAKTQQPLLSQDTQKLRSSTGPSYIKVEADGKGRPGGLFVDWCPQRDVLCHPAIGTYITHCGWNSSQEAITAGVPVITWPLFAEQHRNASFLNRIGVAEPVQRTWQYGRIVPKDEITRAVRNVMAGGRTREVAATYAKKARAALLPGGNTYESWEMFPNY